MGAFQRLWLAQSVSVLGDYVAMFAVQSALVFRMHASAAEVTGILLASLAPTVFLGPLAGTLVDRWNPVRTMIWSDVSRAVCVALLAFAVEPRQMYAISFALSCLSAFFAPSMAVVIPHAAGSEGSAAREARTEQAGLFRAYARLQQSAQVARIASPGIAALLAGVAGEKACYWADSGSFWFSAAVLSGVKFTAAAPAGDTRALEGRGLLDLGRIRGRFVEGISFLRSNRRGRAWWEFSRWRCLRRVVFPRWRRSMLANWRASTPQAHAVFTRRRGH